MIPTLLLSFLGLFLLLPKNHHHQKHRGVLLAVPYQQQFSNELCWAASAAMIMDYWHTVKKDTNADTFSQCEQARYAYYYWNNWTPNDSAWIACDKIACVGDSIPPLFNSGYAPFMFFFMDTSYQSTLVDDDSTHMISWETIVSQIDSGMPFTSLFTFKGVTSTTSSMAGGHWIVVDGYQTTTHSPEAFVSYDDPWGADCSVHKLMSYEEFCHPRSAAFLDTLGFRFTIHSEDIYNIRPLR